MWQAMRSSVQTQYCQKPVHQIIKKTTMIILIFQIILAFLCLLSEILLKFTINKYLFHNQTNKEWLKLREQKKRKASLQHVSFYSQTLRRFQERGFKTSTSNSHENLGTKAWNSLCEGCFQNLKTSASFTSPTNFNYYYHLVLT